MKFKRSIIFLLVFAVLNSYTFSIDFSKRINVCDGELNPILGSDHNVGCAHNVFKIVADDKVKYFKEAKNKKNMEVGVFDIVDEYCDERDINATETDKKLLKKILSVGGNLIKFKNMGVLCDLNSGVYKYLNGDIVSDDLGIPKKYVHELNIDLKQFFTYASKEIFQLERLTFEPCDWFVVNQLATYRLAKYFGISELIVESEPVVLVTKNGEKRGLLTDEAEGIYDYELKDKYARITPEFQRQISNLWILDLITDERDHKSYNFKFRVVDDNKLTGLTAFDCENCFSYFLSNSRVDFGKGVGIAHMDRDLAKKILSVTREKLYILFGDIISESNIDKLTARIEAVQVGIKNSVESRGGFLLNKDEWIEETLWEDLGDKQSFLRYFFDELNLRSD